MMIAVEFFDAVGKGADCGVHERNAVSVNELEAGLEERLTCFAFYRVGWRS